MPTSSYRKACFLSTWVPDTLLTSRGTWEIARMALLFYQWKNWGSKRSDDLLKVTGTCGNYPGTSQTAIFSHHTKIHSHSISPPLPWSYLTQLSETLGTRERRSCAERSRDGPSEVHEGPFPLTPHAEDASRIKFRVVCFRQDTHHSLLPILTQGLTVLPRLILNSLYSPTRP